MRASEGRTIGLYFRVSPEEMDLIQGKMQQIGTLTKRAYLRKMAVDGYIVHVDMGDIKELVKQVSAVGNNVNQIARRCNETGNFYAEDMEDIRKGYAKVQKEIFELVRRLADL